MENIYKLSPANTVAVAKELTIKAIENNLIDPSTEPEKTAEFVAKFYQTLVEHLNDQFYCALAVTNSARAFIVSGRIMLFSIDPVPFSSD